MLQGERSGKNYGRSPSESFEPQANSTSESLIVGQDGKLGLNIFL